MPKKEQSKKTVNEYIDVINWKKWEAHHANILYIEINASDLLTEKEAGVSNVKTVASAMLETMLEGDVFVTELKNKLSSKLTVRYYCDNLSESRKKFKEVE